MEGTWETTPSDAEVTAPSKRSLSESRAFLIPGHLPFRLEDPAVALVAPTLFSRY